MIHYRQMDKPDRDPDQALRADEECRQLLLQFPNSRFAPAVQQRLRNIQEVLADGEFGRGDFYHTKGSYPAAAARLQALTDHYPLYSKADEALWMLADSYSRMPARFSDRAVEAWSRIVREYPLSARAGAAKDKLRALEREIPEADPVALARMKYEQANQDKPGLLTHFWGIFRKSPSVAMAAKSGTPAMSTLQPTLPVSVPSPGAGTGVTADVTASSLSDTSALDTQPDARQNPPGAPPAAPAPAGQQPNPGTARPQNR